MAIHAHDEAATGTGRDLNPSTIDGPEYVASRMRRSKNIAALAGVAAAALMMMLPTLCDEGRGGAVSVLAGSGDGSPTGAYKQPQAGGMNVGTTNTWAAPPPTPATGRAVPAVKAHG
jgi:hypothetical protein